MSFGVGTGGLPMRADRIRLPRIRGFRNFLLRGNVVDLAVGIVVGAAFTSVVNGFVRAFLTPLVGVAVGASGDFSDNGFHVAGVLFPYGAFLTAIVTFVLVAAAVYYFVVLPVNRLQADPGSDFISNGGDSFKATVFSLRLLETAGLELDYLDVLGAPSLGALTRTVEGHGHP
jgi:large conductance mechanosensitive channel protein